MSFRCGIASALNRSWNGVSAAVAVEAPEKSCFIQLSIALEAAIRPGNDSRLAVYSRGRRIIFDVIRIHPGGRQRDCLPYTGSSYFAAVEKFASPSNTC